MALKRLPKGLKKVQKSEMVKEMIAFQEEREILFPHVEKECVEWTENNEKKTSEKVFRW